MSDTTGTTRNISSVMVDVAMSLRKLTAGLLMTLTTVGATARGDGHAPPVDPFAFDPQFRWFEPVYDIDLEELKPEKRAPNGWFATYDRLNLYGSRPETGESRLEGGEFKLDSGWGHRYEVGYMLPHEDNGWTFTYTENDVREDFQTEIDVDVFDDFGILVVDADGNAFELQDRFQGFETLNQFSYDSYELNKTWRLTPYHYGGILEPLIGIRYMEVDDIIARRDVDFSQAVDNILQETATTLTSDTENQILTGQIGFRYFKQRGRFTYSSDFRVFGGGNWQCNRQFTDVRSRFRTDTIIETGDGIGLFDVRDGLIDDVVDANEIGDRALLLTERNEETVVGFDIRGELGYQLTRMIQIRGGFQLIDLATGVWRGGSDRGPDRFEGDQNQDLVMVGGTFGISLNH